MKLHTTILVAAVATALSGCAGTSPTRIIGNTVGAAGGAFLGDTLGEGNPLYTGLGAGAGVLLSESLQAESSAAANRSYAAGYEKGRSDTAKRQYQSLIDQQRSDAYSPEPSVSLFEIPLPEREIDGAILSPSTRTLRIQE